MVIIDIKIFKFEIFMKILLQARYRALSRLKEHREKLEREKEVTISLLKQKERQKWEERDKKVYYLLF